MEIQVGDKIKTRGRFWVWHFGVFIGWNSLGIPIVMHNAKNGGVEEVTLEAFCEGQPVYMVKRAKPGTAHLVVRRALALRGIRYDLINFNCEHFASVAHGEAPESKQLQVAGWTAVAAFTLYAFGRDTRHWDGDVGQYRRSNGQFAGR